MWNSDQRACSLRQLHTLNRHFIAHLLASDASEEAGNDFPLHFTAQLRALEPAALHEVCATPYTLYYLPFGHSTYWHETARLSAQSACADRNPEPPEHATQHLAKLAMFLAWHVACTDAAGARLFFGMSTGTLEFFRQADVATLSGVSVEAAQVLQPRWHSNPYFWPDMIRAAGTDRVRMQAARLLGAQLLAAELHGEHVAQRAPRRLRVSVVRRSALESSLAATTIEQQTPAAFVPL